MFLKQNVAVEHGPKTKRDHLLALYDDRKRKVMKTIWEGDMLWLRSW